MFAPSVLCGVAVCSNVPNDVISMITTQPAQACCADPQNSLCGNINGGFTCAAPPPVAPHCPSALGRPGCCAGGNRCGVDATQLGMGCVEIAQFSAMLPAQLVTNLMLPSPTHCDGTPVPKADAGP
jgi:hypothetical protein